MLKRAIVFLFMLSYLLYATETIRITAQPDVMLVGSGQNLIIDPGVFVDLRGEFGTIENHGLIYIDASSTAGFATFGDTYNTGEIRATGEDRIVINGNYSEGMFGMNNGGHLYINDGGNITINGNFTSNDDGEGPRVGYSSSLTVTGDFTVNGVRGLIGDYSDGNITVKGNYTIGASGSLGVYQDLYLTGTSQQTVTADGYTFFEKLHLENNSTAGIAFSGQSFIRNIYANSTNISSGMDLTLSDYTNIYGDLNINGPVTNNTHLELYGNVTINGDVNNTAYIVIPSGENLIINGNYTGNSNSLLGADTGTATINGNVTLNGDYSHLFIAYPPSSVTVTGDFTVYGYGHTIGYNNGSGNLEIKGDFTVGPLGDISVEAPLYLTGTTQQTVTTNGTDSWILNNLTISNSSPGGVVFTDAISVSGDLIYGACNHITGLDNVSVYNIIVVGECRRSPFSPAVIMYLLN